MIEIRPILSAKKCSTNNQFFNIWFIAKFAEITEKEYITERYILSDQ